MSGLLKYLLAQAAIKGGRAINEASQEEPEAPPERPPEPTPEQMADPIQRSMYEEQMRKYMEWERAQNTGLLNFEK